MMHLKRCLWLALTLLMVAVLSQPAIAYEDKQKKKDGPWETAAIMGGVFFTNVDSGLTLGTTGVGGKIDGEQLLGLDEDPIVWRIDAFWRISKRHRLDFMIYDLSRDGVQVIDQEIDDPRNGVIEIGTEVETKFDFLLAKLTWAYAFFKDERMEIFGGLGAYILGVDFGLKEGGDEVERTEFTYPLPAFRLGASFAITDKFMLRQNIDWFYLSYKDFTGNIVELGVNLDWNFWKYCGVGIGYNFMFMEASKDKDEFLSDIEMSYGGLMLYGKVYF